MLIVQELKAADYQQRLTFAETMFNMFEDNEELTNKEKLRTLEECKAAIRI